MKFEKGKLTLDYIRDVVVGSQKINRYELSNHT